MNMFFVQKCMYRIYFVLGHGVFVCRHLLPCDSFTELRAPKRLMNVPTGIRGKETCGKAIKSRK